MSDKELRVPDLGDDGEAEVIEILVKAGDQIAVEDIVLVLESDKATMEIPAEQAGRVKSLQAALGDQVRSGDVIAIIETAEGEDVAVSQDESVKAGEAAAEKHLQDSSSEEQTDITENPQGRESQEPRLDSEAKGSFVEQVPDTGSDGEAELIEIQCQPGDEVKQDDILFVLESDKATMEIPASVSGTVSKIMVKLGDQLKHGDTLCVIETDSASASAPEQQRAGSGDVQTPQADKSPGAASDSDKQRQKTVGSKLAVSQQQDAHYRNPNVHAGPAARRLARELGVDLAQVRPTGPKERILKDDIKAFVKTALANGVQSSVNPLFDFEHPDIDFEKFGEVERLKLTRINKVSARNLSRSWLTIPHVTQFDEADITELEAYRKEKNPALVKEGIKLTPLAFLVKACAQSLLVFPRFNASLEKSGENLILKKYVHIGVAVDTDDGLVVPVIRDADRKSIKEIAGELSVLSDKARNKKLMPQDMQGACFSISSLGGIGGTAFTPIVNWPEVAILGVSRSQMKPVYDGKDFQPRLILPLSLSYDHRVIDGAEAARFSRHLAELLESGDLLKLE